MGHGPLVFEKYRISMTLVGITHIGTSAKGGISFGKGVLATGTL